MVSRFDALLIVLIILTLTGFPSGLLGAGISPRVISIVVLVVLFVLLVLGIVRY